MAKVGKVRVQIEIRVVCVVHIHEEFGVEVRHPCKGGLSRGWFHGFGFGDRREARFEGCLGRDVDVENVRLSALEPSIGNELATKQGEHQRSPETLHTCDERAPWIS